MPLEDFVMRGFVKPIAAVPLALLALTGVGRVAHAQQSADSIINSLKPSGNLATGATRGIKLGGSPAAAPAPAAAPSSTHAVSTSSAPSRPKPAPAAAAESGPSVNLTVNFPSGSAELTAGARASLDGLGKALSSEDLKSFRFRIEGHTDNVGSADENRTLSQKRAEAVVSYLTSQYKVEPARLEAVGMGQDKPLVDAPPQTPEARNRRVQVINLGT
jgi:OmpA-OmpF porin, OOP family